MEGEKKESVREGKKRELKSRTLGDGRSIHCLLFSLVHVLLFTLFSGKLRGMKSKSPRGQRG